MKKKCTNCKKVKDSVLLWSFDHGDFEVCPTCEKQIRQDIENAIRSELGMSENGILTLG